MFDSTGKLGRQIPKVDVYTNYQRRLTVKLEGYVDTERAKPPTVVKEKVEEVKEEVKEEVEEVKEVIEEEVKEIPDSTGGN